MGDNAQTAWTIQDSLGIAGFILAIILAIMQYVVHPLFIRPKLKIEYDSSKKDDHIKLTRYIDERGNEKTIHNYFFVYTRNKSRFTPARNCTAELQITKWDDSKYEPTKDVKQLTWDDGTNTKDIGATKRERFHMVFSDLIFDKNDESGVHALISTKESLYSPIGHLRGEDSLGIGDYEAQITVRSEDGAKDTAKFKIHITTNYSELTIERIDP